VALAIAEVERQVRNRLPTIKRIFIEAGSAPVRQRWSRPDAVHVAPGELPTPDRTTPT
jgi:hypothetical protein